MPSPTTQALAVEVQSTRSSVRQVLHQLRAALPDGIGPALTDNVVSFSGDVEIHSTAEELLRARQPQSKQPEKRFEEIQMALDRARAGDFFPRAHTEWVETRRAEIASTITDLRLEAAHVAFDLSEYVVASELARLAVLADPLRESGWRLRMRTAALLASFDDVLGLYAECTEALQAVQTKPTFETRSLVDRRGR
ncbi:hypothetical protein [Leucobacter sp. W1478]|uniref:hypothetical protein n=1 Tax=Leucobacter sp. W1478 TaxID=3439065 RepID=UPI003F3BDBBD